ncbi:MAG: hypothetical protein AVDCRST_MAG29-1524, partial [uncultured Nocardioidaceae bacterium]
EPRGPAGRHRADDQPGAARRQGLRIPRRPAPSAGGVRRRGQAVEEHVAGSARLGPRRPRAAGWFPRPAQPRRHGRRAGLPRRRPPGVARGHARSL